MYIPETFGKNLLQTLNQLQPSAPKSESSRNLKPLERVDSREEARSVLDNLVAELELLKTYNNTVSTVESISQSKHEDSPLIPPLIPQSEPSKTFFDGSKEQVSKSEETNLMEREEQFAIQITTVVSLGREFINKINFGRGTHIFTLFHLLDQFSQATILIVEFIDVNQREALVEQIDRFLTCGCHYLHHFNKSRQPNSDCRRTTQKIIILIA